MRIKTKFCKMKLLGKGYREEKFVFTYGVELLFNMLLKSIIYTVRNIVSSDIGNCDFNFDIRNLAVL